VKYWRAEPRIRLGSEAPEAYPVSKSSPGFVTEQPTGFADGQNMTAATIADLLACSQQDRCRGITRRVVKKYQLRFGMESDSIRRAQESDRRVQVRQGSIAIRGHGPDPCATDRHSASAAPERRLRG
jgi:hypothetical protein